MKKNITKTLLFGACVIIVTSKGSAQSTTPANLYGPGRFLGWNGTNDINPLLFQTNATDRMVINGNKTLGINGFLGLALTHDILIFLAYNFNQRSGIP